MDFAKFVSLLDREQLYFARADTLDDPFEGARPRQLAELRAAWEGKTGIPDWFADQRRAARQSTFISAWHANEVESAAMWNLYIRSGDGIAVKSTFGRLCDAMASEERPVYVGAVEYLDYETATFPNEQIFEHNILWQFVRKRLSFAHEREVRAVAENFKYVLGVLARGNPESRAQALSSAGIADVPALDLDEVLPLPPPGLYLAVDLGTLIESIRVAPTAAPWLAELVHSMMDRFSRAEPVRQSSLLSDPIY